MPAILNRYKLGYWQHCYKAEIVLFQTINHQMECSKDSTVQKYLLPMDSSSCK